MNVGLALAAAVALAGPEVHAQPSYSAPLGARTTVSITIPLGHGGDALTDGRLRRLSRRQIAEMAAVGLTGVGHLAFSAEDASVYFIPLAIGGWGGYVGYRAATEPAFLRRAGFTRDGLHPAFREVSWLAAGSLAAMAGIGAAQGTLRIDADVLPLLALYPAWGLTQQFLVQGLVTRHLADAGAPPAAIVPTTALLFGAVHVPNWRLTAATTALGGAYAGLYLRHRNLWPLGLYHGWLGAFFYRWVLDRNPWAEMVGG
jgi:hypothetical protein